MHSKIRFGRKLFADEEKPSMKGILENLYNPYLDLLCLSYKKHTLQAIISETVAYIRGRGLRYKILIMFWADLTIFKISGKEL
ncbi:unnamed protein product [Acanthoscelides obtectus]|uniref:Uncharacterized protein n=1 Tax=Acanthoscelides obtectus TaxID=200917 RepID=A0A9P0PUB4_ACAOB|nr:unnamed protein product [Acanthoscelides obtectus]CAK1676581.1 hypothetical protein AOBTE_LOCUS30834 [Acanthoscelides obtectus]